MYSIRRQLTAIIIVGTAFVLLSASVLLDVMTGLEMQKMFDASLLDKARALRALTEQDRGKVEFELMDGIMPEFNDKRNPQYFQIWVGSGVVLERSQSLNGSDLPRDYIPVGQQSFSDLALPDGRPGRLIEISFFPKIDNDEEADDEDISNSAENSPIPAGMQVVEQRMEQLPNIQTTLVLARERATLDELRFSNRLIIAGTFVIVLSIVAMLVGKYVKNGFAPLDHLVDQVEGIDEKSLDSRIDHEERQSLELAPIEQQLNRLLERLESAFKREKRISADVAHELRTPLAELMTLAEVGRMNLQDRETLQAFFGDVQTISRRMQQIVTNLLELARLDAKQLQLHKTDFLLAELVDSIWSQAFHDPTNARQLQNEIPTGFTVHTDREKLEMILRNLLSNAVTYSPEGALITLYIKREVQGIRLLMENRAVDLEQADIIHMRERFWRKEQARSDTGHSGLGLALVDEMVSLLGMELDMQLDDDKRFTVSIFHL